MFLLCVASGILFVKINIPFFLVEGVTPSLVHVIDWGRQIKGNDLREVLSSWLARYMKRILRGPSRFPLDNKLGAKIAQNDQTLQPQKAPAKLLHP